MHMKYGNSMSSKRKGNDSDTWTPANAHNDRRAKRLKTTRKTASRHGQDLERPDRSESAKVHITSRARYSYSQKAKFLAIFDSTAETFFWLSRHDLLLKFCESNPAVPARSMLNFLRDRDTIVALAHQTSPSKIRQSKVSPARLALYKVGQFEQIELVLRDECLARHESGLMVSSEWVMSVMRQKLANLEEVHGCTRGWLIGFMNRFAFSFRKASNVHSQTVLERKDLIETFYRYIKVLCTPSPDAAPSDKYGRFPLSRRIHGDQVPLEFQGTLTRSLAPKGAKRVQIKQPKFNMDFRVATLMLYFVADADEPWLRPALCFRLLPTTSDGFVDHTVPKSGRVREEFVGLNRDFPGIDIYVQKKGYFDKTVCLQAANDLVDSFRDPGEYLVCLDNLGGQTNLEFRDILKREGNAFILYTPPNCTDVLAVTDAGLGRTIKNLIRKRFKCHFDANLSAWVDGTVTPAMRRRLYCEWLVAAMSEFYCDNGQQQVRRAFEKCGLAGAYDGSDDDKISIDGFDMSQLDISL